MEGFINKEYYVECSSHKEICEFLKMCDSAGLLLRSGNTPTVLISSQRQGAIFAYNWRGEGDGISCWSSFNEDEPLHSDDRLPHVPFQILKSQENNTNVVDILNLL